MQFEWDTEKNNANIQKHGIDFCDAVEIFTGVILEQIDTRKDYGEKRSVALGVCRMHILFVVYTDRNSKRRIISARLANKLERKIYSKYSHKGK